MLAQHEQFVGLRLQLQGVRNDSTFSENLEQQGGERTNSNIDDTNKFINDYSVRNRLRMLGQPQNNVHKLNIHDMAAFYAPSNRTQIRSNFNFNPSRLNSNTNFRLTLNVIMVPFINSNRLVTVDVEHWEILSDLGLIQDVTFTDESAVGIEQTLTEIIPIIQETGRQSDTAYINIKDYDSCLEYLLNWGLHASAEDILKRPVIIIDNEKDMTEVFWRKIKNTNLNYWDDLLLIRQNLQIVEFEYPTIIVLVVDTGGIVAAITLSIFDDERLSNYISEYEVVTKRQKSLEMLKAGFNICGLMKRSELYLTLNSEEFLNQLDEHQIEMTIYEVPAKIVDRNKIYDWLKHWFQWRNSFASINGGSSGSLPIVRTCANILILCRDYSSVVQFYESLDECLCNSEGFSESAYNNIHSSIITSTQDIQQLDDSMSSFPRIKSNQIEDQNRILSLPRIESNQIERQNEGGVTIEESIEVIDLTIDDSEENEEDIIHVKEELKDNNEFIQLTNLSDDHVIIDLESEAYSMENHKPRRRSKRHINNLATTDSTDSQNNILQFVIKVKEDIYL
ncbi:hypothetical protein RhiirA4_479025 [Rhizophagus irregularis]|uniref:Uncharacterized protein n=1 Tax=Rhizophagus irregularis TaxID=588596 RepID=A0A2I1HFS4_9GLOM|nr:hypothetical protein RhiirA4_479025 [Rhizophagus irregularis]